MSINLIPDYWYTGYCPDSDRLLKLPRTQAVELIARALMLELAQADKFAREGKMYGVLLVESKSGERRVLKAFSGLLNGDPVVEGWVPPILGRDRIAAVETETLVDLELMKQELMSLDLSVMREEYRLLAAGFSDRLAQLSIEHRQRKELRQQVRDLAPGETCLPELEAQSRQDGRERRQLKQERDLALQPLQAILAQNDERVRELKQQRKIKSRQFQTQMHDAYRLMNFLGTAGSLRKLMPGGIPTGTGDCCAPKLLHYAATHQFKPIAMAEFWWGENSRDKRQGEFYGACAERCQPLMGFMLAGVTPPAQSLNDFSLPIVYADEYLIAVDKPTELLSVPGRYLHNQDSVLTRLQQFLSGEEIYPVHRLDFETSGILLVARDRQTCQQLNYQFRHRQVQKVYEAILGGNIGQMEGIIELPLSPDPSVRLRQMVDFVSGKPSSTKFRVLEKVNDYTRIEFSPLTGRTHQLRVHAADLRGLGVPILGDTLYGCQVSSTKRLYLHATELIFTHPSSKKPGELIHLSAAPHF